MYEGYPEYKIGKLCRLEDILFCHVEEIVIIKLKNYKFLSEFLLHGDVHSHPFQFFNKSKKFLNLIITRNEP